MNTEPLEFVTFTPMRVNFSLQTGVSEQSAGYYDLLYDLKRLIPSLFVPAIRDQKREYESLKEDVRDLRVFVWRLTISEQQHISFHVYANKLAIVEVVIKGVSVDTAKTLEQKAQAETVSLIKAAYPKFCAVQNKILRELRHPLVSKIKRQIPLNETEDEIEAKLFWTSRTIRLTDRQKNQAAYAKLFRDWLAETKRPEDAEELIAGVKSYSMTWLEPISKKPK